MLFKGGRISKKKNHRFGGDIELPAGDFLLGFSNKKDIDPLFFTRGFACSISFVIHRHLVYNKSERAHVYTQDSHIWKKRNIKNRPNCRVDRCVAPLANNRSLVRKEKKKRISKDTE